MKGKIIKVEEKWSIEYTEFCEMIEGHAVIKNIIISENDLELFSNEIEIGSEVEFKITSNESEIIRFVNTYLKDERFINNNLNPKIELKEKLDPVFKFISLLKNNNIRFNQDDINKELKEIDINAIEYYLNKLYIS